MSTETKTATTIETATLKTKHVAKIFNVKPTSLRRVLRSMPEYADGVHTNYKWSGDKDPMLVKIGKAIAKAAEEKKARAEAAKKLLAKKQEEAKAQAALDAKAK